MRILRVSARRLLEIECLGVELPKYEPDCVDETAMTEVDAAYIDELLSGYGSSLASSGLNAVECEKPE